jgi:hypothetical protein
VPKLVKGLGSGACRSRLPNFGVAKHPERVSFQRLHVGLKPALISSEGDS